jgi:hypothetical protein
VRLSLRVLYDKVTPGTYPRGTRERCSTWVGTSRSIKYQTRLLSLAKNKTIPYLASSKTKEKSLKTFTTRPIFIKHFTAVIVHNKLELS